MSRGSVLRELPLLSVLAMLAAGVILVAQFDRWRLGSFVMGFALCGGAICRLSLPPRQAGMLVVRSKAFDAGVLLALGFALVILANTIPTS